MAKKKKQQQKKKVSHLKMAKAKVRGQLFPPDGRRGFWVLGSGTGSAGEAR